MVDAMEYKLMINRGDYEFGKGVAAMLNEGWTLYGNPFMGALENGTPCYCQALTRANQMSESDYKITFGKNFKK